MAKIREYKEYWQMAFNDLRVVATHVAIKAGVRIPQEEVTRLIDRVAREIAIPDYNEVMAEEPDSELWLGWPFEREG